MIIGKQYINGTKNWTPVTCLNDDAVVLVTDRPTYQSLNFAVVRNPEFDDEAGKVCWGHAVAYDCGLNWAWNIWRKHMVCDECGRVHTTLESYRNCNCEVD